MLSQQCNVDIVQDSMNNVIKDVKNLETVYEVMKHISI